MKLLNAFPTLLIVNIEINGSYIAIKSRRISRASTVEGGDVRKEGKVIPSREP